VSVSHETKTPAAPPRADWYASDVSAVAQELGVEPEHGLSAEEARGRLQSHGRNRLAGAKKESGFQAFLRQYQDFMQIILLAAAAISLFVTGDVGTAVVLAGLTVFNAVVGLRQEAKAEESVKALAQMMKTIARVRRGGQALEIDAEELVPGDVVLMEAGNRVPADGRICVAATLEIEEAALTGESLPVAKSTDPVPGDEVPLGDRTCMAYMNTSVTRGRGEMVVTATSMDTEISHIANLLATTQADKTPLQKQLDGLSKIIAAIAGVALVLVIILGLVRGQSFDTLFITGVALAVAAIPTGLPAVVTALLSIGTREIARRNAIVKRLPAVETLGSTSVICSDKTGTLTLNKMTARELAIPGQHRFTVSGEGYSTDGEIKHVGGSHIDLDPYLLPMALCADAVLDGTELIGDPTEGALIVLAAKGGLDLVETRRSYPRSPRSPSTPTTSSWPPSTMVIDIPIAVALGFDEPTSAIMRRPPRPVGAPVLSRADWVRLCVLGLVMTVGSLVAYQIGDADDGPAVAATMLLTTLSLFHVAAGLLARDQHNTIFDRAALPGTTQLRRYGIALLAIIAVTTIGFLQPIFHTTELSFAQWSTCIGLAASLVVVEELIKLAIRRRDRRRVTARTEPSLSGA
jgi:magnesium-transporting ATPase (P-type)